MKIPNVSVIIHTHNGLTRGELYLPEYEVAVLRVLYDSHLDKTKPGGGLEVKPYPENGDPEMQYRLVFSVPSELSFLRNKYGPKEGPRKYADAAWNEDTLKKEMERILAADFKRIQEAAKPKELAVPHATFLAFGLTAEQARTLQAAGYADRAACVGQSLVDLANVHGISITDAGRLIAADVKVEAKK